MTDQELKDFVFSLASSIKELKEQTEKEFRLLQLEREEREREREERARERELREEKERREREERAREIERIEKKLQAEREERERRERELLEKREKERERREKELREERERIEKKLQAEREERERREEESFAKWKEELRKEFEKTEKQMRETDRKLKSMGIQLGGITQNLGDIAEEYFINSLENKMELLGMKFDVLDVNLYRRKGKLQNEYDIILRNDDSVVVIEVKYKLHVNDIKKLDRKVEIFKDLFPEYSHLKLYAGLASFNTNEDVKELAKERGYFILQRKGDIIETYAPNLKVS